MLCSQLFSLKLRQAGAGVLGLPSRGIYCAWPPPQICVSSLHDALPGRTCPASAPSLAACEHPAHTGGTAHFCEVSCPITHFLNTAKVPGSLYRLVGHCSPQAQGV